jgi:ATP-dependent RNA helicase DDX54/DBP10
MARTGSGKTVAFLVPLMEKLLATERGVHGNHVRGIILSPTRELSLQTLKVFNKLAADTDLRAIGIHGGEGMEKQFNLLASKPDIIIATPGRLAHHLAEIPDFTLSGCLLCILDEADRLLEMGFAGQLKEIARSLPENCQKALLSATMPKVLVEFTKSGFAVDPAVVRLDQEASVSAELRIAFITCRSLDKDAALLHVLQHIKNDQKDNEGTRTGLTLIFAATRHHVEYVSALLEASGYGVTMIYGTLDQEARKANLAAFRHGEKPVLVVTDVAARGIDVPLIDHVIHYHFPPQPKLFVHRSGRAARAGRIGYCWGLVEPDELPYMIELHLFLGRRPCANEIKGEDGDKGKNELSYTLSEMTPEMVHYGSVPESVLTEEVENVERIRKAELSGSAQAETLRSLTKTCRNAMKQYRRTRTEASREAIRRAKAILEGDRQQTGQRVGCGGTIPPHPLLQGIERQRQKTGETKAAEIGGGIGGLDNIRKREEFLRALSNFRPRESVFEAFATGKNKDVGIASHVDFGRTTSKNKNDSSAALNAMKNMRRQMRMARDKGSSLVVAGSANALELNGDIVDVAGSESDEEEDNALPETKKTKLSAPVEDKRRLSKAERRRLKKDPDTVMEDAPANTQDKPKKEMSGSDFRDPNFYMENNFTSNSEEAQRSRKIEASMQPSAAGTVRGSMGHALRLEEAMLDIVGDDNEELVKNQRMTRWDKSKRKYVQTTVGSELSGDSKTKKTRLESGQLVKNDKMKLGQLYVKWQKKTNRSVGRTGVFDDVDGAGAPAETGKKMKGTKGARDGGKASGGDDGGDEVKTSTSIKKEREKKQNMNMKNMKKGARQFLERKQKEDNKPKGGSSGGKAGGKAGGKSFKKGKW